MTLPGNRVIRVDVLFPVLHGKNGEDGTIQGFAEMMNIAYVGPSVIGAAVTMDKNMTKQLLSHVGVPVVPWRIWTIRKRPCQTMMK